MLLLGIIFVATLCFSFLVLALFTRPSQMEKTVNQRVGAIILAGTSGGQSQQETEDILKRQAGQQFATLDRVLSNLHLNEKLQVLLQQANSTATPGKVVAACAGLGMAAFVLSFMVVSNPIVEALIPLPAAFIPIVVLRFQRDRRLKKFNEALPDAIDLMARALRAGHSVSSAIEVVAEQSQEPVASEFDSVYKQQNFGLPFRDALIQLADRVPSKDLQFVVTAMLVQKETGGNLTEILDRTTHVIRERIRIHGEIQTKTAQGRMTGWILGLLPVVMGVLINFVNPGYATPLFHDPLGKKMLYIGAGLLVVGGLIIRKIIQIEV